MVAFTVAMGAIVSAIVAEFIAPSGVTVNALNSAFIRLLRQPDEDSDY